MDFIELIIALKDFNLKEVWKDEWLRENVLLSIYKEHIHGDMRYHVSFSRAAIKRILKGFGKSTEQISNEIKEFCYYSYSESQIENANIQFYGYYADYDWVVFCWLFGRMIDLPTGFPMYCKDLKQILDEKVLSACDGNINETNRYLKNLKSQDDYPKQLNEHNALSDARWNKELYEFIHNLSDLDNIKIGIDKSIKNPEVGKWYEITDYLYINFKCYEGIKIVSSEYINKNISQNYFDGEQVWSGYTIKREADFESEIAPYLIKEVQTRYPKGSIVKSVCGPGYKFKVSDNIHCLDDQIISGIDYFSTLYYKGRWAKILSNKRESGYYKVIYKNKEEIAEYDSHNDCFYLIRSEHKFNEFDFSSIKERVG